MLLLLPTLLLLPSLASSSSVTILVLLDGLRHDYLDSFALPNVKNLSSAGVWVPRVRPVFPASLAPNLASLATGAQPEDHDVIDDQEVFDSGLGRVLNRGEKEFWAKAKALGTIWVNIMIFLN